MTNDIFLFLIHLGITALSLWIASFIFHGIKFANTGALTMAALLLGLANAFIRPITSRVTAKASRVLLHQ